MDFIFSSKYMAYYYKGQSANPQPQQRQDIQSGYGNFKFADDE